MRLFCLFTIETALLFELPDSCLIINKKATRGNGMAFKRMPEGTPQVAMEHISE